jgi:hypothetical protein
MKVKCTSKHSDAKLTIGRLYELFDYGNSGCSYIIDDSGERYEWHWTVKFCFTRHTLDDAIEHFRGR